MTNMERKENHERISKYVSLTLLGTPSYAVNLTVHREIPPRLVSDINC